MRGWEKELPRKPIFSTFSQHNALISCYNSVKGLRVNKTVKEIIFERVRIELESKKRKFPQTTIREIPETNHSFHVK